MDKHIDHETCDCHICETKKLRTRTTELEAELRYKTNQWEDVKDMLAHEGQLLKKAEAERNELDIALKLAQAGKVTLIEQRDIYRKALAEIVKHRGGAGFIASQALKEGKGEQITNTSSQ
jgi:hypothetical protein